MVATPTVIGGVAVVVLLAVSAFFSSTEIAVFSLAPEWVTDRVAAGDRRAASLAELREDPHRLLVTLLVGNNVVNIAIASIVTVLVTEALPPGRAIVAATLLTSAAVLVFGEILPKSYGLGHAEEWALTVAGPVRLVELLLYPLVAVFDLLTRRLSRLVGGETAIEEPYVDD